MDEGVEISYSSHQQQDHGSRQQQLTDASCLPEESAAIQSNLGLDQSESQEEEQQIEDKNLADDEVAETEAQKDADSSTEEGFEVFDSHNQDKVVASNVMVPFHAK